MKTNNNIPAYRFQGYTDAWELRKLGEVAEIVMGQSPDSKNYTDNPLDNILVQGNADLRDGFVVPRVWTTQVTKTAEKGDLILSVRAPVGDVGRTNYNVVLGRGVAGIKGNEFIYHLLVKMKLFGYWTKLSTGSTFESINSDDIKNSIILFPTLPEQKAIGTFFSTLDQQITLHQRKLDMLKEQKKTYLKLLFPAKGQTKPALRFQGFEDDWKEVKLGDMVLQEIKGKAKSEMLGSTEVYLETEYLNGGTKSFVDCEKDVEEDDILILWDGSQAGMVYHGFSGALGSTLKAYRPKESGKFIYYQLVSHQNLIFEKYRTPNIPHVIKTFTDEFHVFYTSLPEQEAIGTFFQTLDQEISQVEDKLASLKEMKKTLLRKLFV
ncbi:restriction endonuclease subunit S [Streptococcus suis]|uniref:restriction endonuclease subunit S n=1 Tax=Streptococcus suis TaxID=1307 RepID=UPI002FC86A67